MLNDKNAPVNRFIDPKKAENFLRAPNDYGKPWFGQLMAYMLQLNYWLREYGIA